MRGRWSIHVCKHTHTCISRSHPIIQPLSNLSRVGMVGGTLDLEGGGESRERTCSVCTPQRLSTWPLLHQLQPTPPAASPSRD